MFESLSARLKDYFSKLSGRAAISEDNLHPYDNRERRFRHDDSSAGKGRAIVAELLHIDQHAADQASFDLSYFSGGIGVIDRLAISLPANAELWSRVSGALKTRLLSDVPPEDPLHEDILWLLTGEEDLVPLQPAAVRFLNRERKAFQSECVETDRIMFNEYSNVNAWTALWGTDTKLNYLYYDQG